MAKQPASTNAANAAKPDLSHLKDVDTSTPATWEFKNKGDWIFGTVVKVKTVKRLNKKKEEEETRLAILDTSDGLRAVWETAILSDLFDELGTGEEVYFEYDGKEELDGGRTMNKFIVKKS